MPSYKNCFSHKSSLKNKRPDTDKDGRPLELLCIYYGLDAFNWLQNVEMAYASSYNTGDIVTPSK